MKKAAQSPAMLTLRKITRLFALVFLFLVIVGFFMSSGYRVERSVLIDAPRDFVYENLLSGDFLSDWMYIENGQVERFSNTLQEGDSVAISYTGSDEQGLLSVTESAESVVRFNVQSRSTVELVQNRMELVPDGNSTRVSWIIEGELKSGLLSPYLALFANDIAGANFELSLQSLKEQIEARY